MWEKLPQDVPYVTFDVNYDVAVPGQVKIVEIPVEPGVRGDFNRLFKKYDRYLSPASISLKYKIYRNGNLYLTDDNRDKKYIDDRFLPAYGPQTTEGYNRIINNIIGKHARVLINETIPMIKGEYNSEDMDRGKDGLVIGAVGQGTWLLLLGIFGMIIGILGFYWLYNKLNILKGETPKSIPQEWEKTKELYKHAFERGFIKMEDGTETSLWSEALEGRIEKDIEKDINEKKLLPMDKDSRRYFWEKYYRAVPVIFRPYIEKVLEDLGFTKYRLSSKDKLQANQLETLINKGIVKADEKDRNKIIWLILNKDELKTRLMGDADFEGTSIKDILDVFEKENSWTFQQVSFLRKDKYIWNKDVDVFEYVSAYILHMLVDRIINGYKPQYKEDRIDLENSTGMEENGSSHGIYVKVERPRRFAKTFLIKNGRGG